MDEHAHLHDIATEMATARLRDSSHGSRALSETCRALCFRTSSVPTLGLSHMQLEAALGITSVELSHLVIQDCGLLRTLLLLRVS